MTNRLQDRVDRLAERLQDEAGRSVVYLQGETERIVGTATPVDETYIIHNDEGPPTEIQGVDWLITASLLEGLTPRAGDEIQETIGSVEHTYQVLPMDKRPCCEWHDNAGTILVVHTKRTNRKK